MEVSTGDLLFVTDGFDYSCIWVPTGHNYDCPHARLLAIIACVLVEDQNDLGRWKEEVTNRYTRIAAKILDAKPGDITYENLPGRSLN